VTDPDASLQTGGVRTATSDVRVAAERPDFTALFRAEIGYVMHALRKLGAPERELEDLAHDVFVAVHRKLDDYDPERPVRPWLFGIAFRVASDHRRRAQSRREVLRDGPADIEDVRPSAEEQMARGEDRRLVTRALDAIAIDRRAVFVMHDMDGISVPEIARVLEVPLNTAYSRLRLAREEFRDAVRRLSPSTGGGK
jgi:RNA polymerase sigma-70 factor, ECF subfamily